MTSTPRTEAEWVAWLTWAAGQPPATECRSTTRGVGRPATSGRPPSALPESRPAKPGAQCLEDDCDAGLYARGRCRKHYRRFMRDNRTSEQREFDRKDRNHGNASRKNTPCIICSRMCWGTSRKAPIPDYVCLDCR
jgi:hypothetical protein